MECIKYQLDNYYDQCLKNSDGSRKKLKARGEKSGMVLDNMSIGGATG